MGRRATQQLLPMRPWTAALVVMAVVALLAFATLAGEVVEGETHAFDHTVLVALGAPEDPAAPTGPRWLADAARDFTALGSTAVLIFVVAAGAGYLALRGRRAEALLLVGAVGGGTMLSSVLKLGFDRPRPGFGSPLVEVYTASFPSGHAMLSAVTYLTLGAMLIRGEGPGWTKTYILALAVLTTFLVGASRIYLGVHWPTDVLAGWSVGAAWTLLCWLLASVLPRGFQQSPISG